MFMWFRDLVQDFRKEVLRPSYVNKSKVGGEGGKLLVMNDAEEVWGKEGYAGLSRWVACQLEHVPDDDQIDIAQNLIMRQLGRRKWRQEPFSEEIAKGEGAYEIFAHLERAYKRNGGADGSDDWLVENWRRVPRGARENFMSVAFRLYLKNGKKEGDCPCRR